MKSKKVILNVIDIMLFVVLLVVATGKMYQLFYNQATVSDGRFFSDIAAYIQEILGTNELYDFPYRVMFDTASFFMKFLGTAELSMAVTITFYNVIALIITKLFISYVTKAKVESTLATFALFFVSMIYSDDIAARLIGYHYLGVFSPNPWHNATYMAARPFMILSFILGAITVSRYEEDFKNKLTAKTIGLYVAYAMSLLLVTMTKPSYTIIHLFTLAFIMLFRFVVSKFGNFKQSLIYAICYIPTLIALLNQFSGVFTGETARGEESGIGIELFRVWNKYTPNLPLSLFLAGAFPIVVLLFHFKDLKKDNYYRFSWQLYAAGLITSIVFYEKGFREGHFNFAWGYMCGLFIAFMMAFVLLIKDVREAITLRPDRGVLIKKVAIVCVEAIPMLIHVYMGCRYFMFLSEGGLYY